MAVNWTDLLKAHVEETYRAAEGLMSLVSEDDLEWKPATGANWMTTGQLLMHMTGACGDSCRAFVTGDWRLPDGTDLSEMSPDQMVPPAESLPTAGSVREARAALAADKQLALEMIDQAGDRMEEPTPAPWDPRPSPLGAQLLGMIDHLNNHKSQLFYYLKLQGKPVNTMHLYGMA